LEIPASDGIGRPLPTGNVAIASRQRPPSDRGGVAAAAVSKATMAVRGRTPRLARSNRRGDQQILAAVGRLQPEQDHPNSFSAKLSGWTAKANVHRKRLQKVLLRRKPLDQVMRDRTCGCLAL